MNNVNVAAKLLETFVMLHLGVPFAVTSLNYTIC